MQTASERGEPLTVVTLHARHEHGGFPVKVLRPGEAERASFEVGWPQGSESYESARQLLRALYNNGDTSPQARDPGITFDRYFKVNDHAPKDDIVGPTIFDLFAVDDILPDPPTIINGVVGVAPKRVRPRSPKSIKGITTLSMFGSGDTDKAIIVQPVDLRWADPRLTVDPASTGPIGIDLEHRSHEVRKLLFAGFGSRMFRSGYDPEDVLQEVYKGLLARNLGRCRFDPSKSSFGHYVHMVISCVLANYHRKNSRRAAHEQVGMYVRGESEDGAHADAALAANDVPEGVPPWSGEATAPEASAGEAQAIESLQLRILDAGRPEGELATQALPLVYMGYSRAEVARELGVEPSKAGRALALIREVARPWGSDLGIAVS
jgi:DNA-directed RNA polymerase specialized sigma24 family protein